MVSKKSIHNLRARAARSQSYIAQCKRHWCTAFFMHDKKGPSTLCGALPYRIVRGTLRDAELK